jgi:hypothetical protein
MAFADEIEKNNINPVILVELDIGQEQEFFVNYAAGTWFVNFDKAYLNIDSGFLAGVEVQDIANVGSVIWDTVRLVEVSSIAICQNTDSSFYYSSSDNELYVRGISGMSPVDHKVIIGVSQAFRRGGTTSIYNSFLYENRIRQIGLIKKSKDANFFGILFFNSATVSIVNVDGEYDRFAIDNDVYGGEARVLLGFDGLDYTDFRKIFTGLMENPQVTEDELKIKFQDQRKRLLRSIPFDVFDATTYPNINVDNVGKPIPLGYGDMRNVPVICTNEEEAGPPADYSFKLFDVSEHSNGIEAITTVYVDGVSKATSGTDLTNATFTIANANYTAGQEVTADVSGFVNDDSNLIENAHDIIVDIMDLYAGLPFINDIYNQSHWDRSKSPNINLFINDKEKIIDIIKNIVENAILGTFFVEDDGRYALRIFDENAASLDSLDRWELIETPKVKYDNSEILTSTVIGYNKDWNEGSYRLLEDKSQETTIFDKFRIYNEEEFDTLLLNSTAAQTYSDTRLEFSGDVETTFIMKTDYRVIEREIGDIITVDCSRANATFLGTVRAEIIGKSMDIMRHIVSLTCRVIEFEAETVHQYGTYYNDRFYNDGYYSITSNEEV